MKFLLDSIGAENQLSLDKPADDSGHQFGSEAHIEWQVNLLFKVLR